MEPKLVNKMSALENNVSAALSNIEERLESLEGQSLTHFSRVRNFLPEASWHWCNQIFCSWFAELANFSVQILLPFLR